MIIQFFINLFKKKDIKETSLEVYGEFSSDIVWHTIESKEPIFKDGFITIVKKKNGMILQSASFNKETKDFYNPFETKIYSIVEWALVPVNHKDLLGESWFIHHKNWNKDQLNPKNEDNFPYHHYKEISETGIQNLIVKYPRSRNFNIVSAENSHKHSELVSHNGERFPEGTLYRYIKI